MKPGARCEAGLAPEVTPAGAAAAAAGRWEPEHPTPSAVSPARAPSSGDGMHVLRARRAGSAGRVTDRERSDVGEEELEVVQGLLAAAQPLSVPDSASRMRGREVECCLRPAPAPLLPPARPPSRAGSAGRPRPAPPTMRPRAQPRAGRMEEQCSEGSSSSRERERERDGGRAEENL
eukprot:3086648-Rhodomonas_salina.1